MHTVLCNLGFSKSSYEPCIYIKKSNNLFIVLALFDNDFDFSKNKNDTIFLIKELQS